MNALVVFFTKYGNTKRVAEAVAAVLAGDGEARVLAFDDVTPGDLAEADLVVAGSPTWYQAVPKDVKAILKAWPRRILRGKQVAAFDTSAEMWKPLLLMTAAHGLLATLRRLGGKAIARPATFFIERSTEPDDPETRRDVLRKGELDRAIAWARELRNRMAA